MSPLLIFFLAFLSLLLLLYFTHRILSSSSINGKVLPPSPPKLPIIGNLHQLGPLPHRALWTLAQRYGPLMFLKLGSVPTIVVSSAEMAREVMKTQDQNFASRPPLAVARINAYDATDMAFAPYSEYWRQVRKITVLHLLSAKKVQSFQHVREEEIALKIDKFINSSPNGIVDVSKMLISLTNDITSRVTVGKTYYGEEGNNTRLCEMVQEGSVLAVAFHAGDFFPRLGWLSKLSGTEARMKRISKKWDEFLDEVIDDHLQHDSSKAGGAHDQDLMDVLLSLRQDESLTLDNVKALIVDMFSAGTDTSYSTMEWGMAELVRNPKIMIKVQEEIRRIVAGKTMVEKADISKMIYLKAVIKEALRLHLPAPLLIPRESIVTTRIEGYEIPAKARVIVNAWALGQNSEYWDAPEKFLPERFLNSMVDYKGHDFHFIPFGAGRRICPGMFFAVSTVELALANLLYHFDWSLPYGKNPETLDMSESFGIVIRMKSNLVLQATARNSTT